MMKAEEIRSALAAWEKEDIVKLYTATYRRLPKEVKEEIDEVIKAGPKQKVTARKKPAEKQKRSINELADEVETLISDAMDGNYYYANRNVSKKQRSNWRLTVKGMIKELMTFTPEDDAYDYSNILLCKLYHILGRACTFYTFVSQDPYHALGYETQIDMLLEICERIRKAKTVTDQVLTQLLVSSLSGYNDRETVNTEAHFAVLDTFETEEERERLLALAETVFAPVKAKYEKLYKGHLSFSITEEEIVTQRNYNSLCWFIVAVKVILGRYDEAYHYAMNVDPESNKEIDLYCILSYYIEDKEAWIRVYDMAVADSIKPRSSLKEHYQKLKGKKKEEND